MNSWASQIGSIFQGYCGYFLSTHHLTYVDQTNMSFWCLWFTECSLSRLFLLALSYVVCPIIGILKLEFWNLLGRHLLCNQSMGHHSRSTHLLIAWVCIMHCYPWHCHGLGGMDLWWDCVVSCCLEYFQASNWSEKYKSSFIVRFNDKILGFDQSIVHNSMNIGMNIGIKLDAYSNVHNPLSTNTWL